MKNTDVSVYEVLRNKIINLEYKPGEELNVNSLAEELGVSRSPIRDALLRLELDKLVDIFPQKGTRVAFLDRKIIKQERFMRINLELGVLDKFLNELTDENKRKIYITKLRAILLEQNASFLAGDKKLFLELDDKLHHFFYENSDNEWLWNVIQSHTGNDHRIRILSYNAENVANIVENEHEAIITAIEEANNEKAFDIDQKHLESLTYVIDSLCKQYPEYFAE